MPLLLLTLVGCGSAVVPVPAVDNRGGEPACVDDAAVDAARRLAVEAAQVSATDLPDLDDDGTANEVRYYAFDQCGTGGCVFEAYLRRDACVTWIGSFEAHGALAVSGPGPMRPFTARWDLGCCAYVEARHAWTGDQYEVEAERACSGPGDGSPPTCEAWHAPPSGDD